MTSEQLMEILQQRGLLADRLLLKLREKMAEADRPWSAEALAKFLVQKKHLSQSIVADLLNETAGAPPQPAGGQENKNEDELSLERDADELVFDLGPYRAPKDTPPAEDSKTPPTEVTDRTPLKTVANFEDLSTAKAARQDSSNLMSDPVLADVSLRAGADPLQKTSSGTSAKKLIPRMMETETDKVLSKEKKRLRQIKEKSHRKKTSEWDSPLLLWGGGALALLIISGIALWLMINWESGDEQLLAARTALAEGSYRQAIADFERFVNNHPQHPEFSLARSQLAAARVRQAVEGNNPVSLEIAQQELEAVEDEEKFNQVQDEFAALLPQIARSLAESAEVETDTAEAGKKVDQATAALALSMNTKYVPRSLRDDNELDQIREILARVELRQTAQKNLATGLAAMRESIDAGNSRGAYEARRSLLDQHPELVADPRLVEMVAATSAAEMAEVRFVREEKPAVKEERPMPWLASLALANHMGGATAQDTGVACVMIDGAVYALDVATGKLLWRRFVGFDCRAIPISIGRNVLVGDALTNDLMLLDAQTGRLLWRQQFDGSIAEPRVVGERLYVADQSGKLYVLDQATGHQLGYIQFAQRLSVSPAVDRNGKRLYVVGDHSSIYAISLEDLSCLGVYYLGHEEGSIAVSPTVILDHLAVLENNGVATSQLHVLKLDEKGAITGSAATERLDGLAATSPLVQGRRMVVITDRGQIRAFDLGIGDQEVPLTLVADRPAAGRKPVIRHAAMTDGSIWLADEQMTRLAILPTGNRLPVRDIEQTYSGDTFDHPLVVLDNTLIHVRRQGRGSGIVAAATDIASGRELWSIEFGVPPGGRPLVSATDREIVVANANGLIFRLDEGALRSRVQDQPLRPTPPPVDLPPIELSRDLGNGRALFAARGETPYLLLYGRGAAGPAARWVKLPGPLACEPAAFADGMLVALKIGQVFYLQSQTGGPAATPFQPPLEPRQTVAWQPIGVVGGESKQFVITDGHEKIYLVELQAGPEPRLVVITEADAGSFPIRSAVAVIGRFAVAGTQAGDLVRFELPALKAVEPLPLGAAIAWGPYHVGGSLLAVTINQELICLSPDATITWQAKLSHDDLAGEPIVFGDSILLAYRRGMVEKRSMVSGESLATADVGQPLEDGPVRFESRIVLPTHDGNLLIVNEP